jgi:hypothetical protein
MTKKSKIAIACGAALVLVLALVVVITFRASQHKGPEPAKSQGLNIIGAQGWQVLSTASVTDDGSKVSVPGYSTSAWLPVKPDGTSDGVVAPGDSQLAKATWDDNDITLWPGESQTLTATYKAADLGGAEPLVGVGGLNTDQIVVRTNQ